MTPSKILTKELLELEYVQNDLSTRQIAKKYGIKSHYSVLEALKKFTIPAIKQRLGRDIMKGRKGYQDISGTYLYNLQYRAKSKKLEYTVTPQYLWDLFLKQNKKCALSGITIDFAKKLSIIGRKTQTASLDRIDSSKGYIPGNVQWVHKTVNEMKLDLTVEEFLYFCKAIANNDSNNLY